MATVVFLSALCALASATDVSGDVWGEWTAAGNPYNVVGDLRVPPGSTLVIGPGCYVEFQGYYGFLIDSLAILQAVGSESDSVNFTTVQTSINWDGLQFSYADSGTQMNHCLIERGYGQGHNYGGGIHCENSFLRIENSLIKNNIALDGSAIYLRDNYDIIIENNSIENNHGQNTIYSISNDQIQIVGNIITNNDSANVIVTADHPGGTKIAENLFFDNHLSTIVEVEGGGTIVEDNIIFNNSGVVFWCWMISSQSIFRRNIIYNNYCPLDMCGGIFLSEDSDYLVENNTICNNSGVYGSYLANIFEEHSTNNPVEFKNNIIWGNSYRNSQDSLILLTDVIFTLIYCDIQGGWSGIGNIMADPMFVDTANGDFHLLPDRPASTPAIPPRPPIPTAPAPIWAPSTSIKPPG